MELDDRKRAMMTRFNIMNAHSKARKFYLSITVALIVIIAAIATTLSRATIWAGNSFECNENSTTTISASYINNLTTNGQFVLAMPAGCTAKLFLMGVNDQSNDSDSILRTMVGTWYFSSDTYGVEPLPDKNVINWSLNLPPAASANQSESTNYNYTMIINASASSKGFYVWRTPYNGYIPLTVGYSVSDINMTKDYPGFAQPIPSAGGALTILAISGAYFGYANRS